MPIIDMGLDYDGRCAYCRDWIKPTHDPFYTRGVIGHGITHALCSIYGPPPPESRYVMPLPSLNLSRVDQGKDFTVPPKRRPRRLRHRVMRLMSLLPFKVLKRLDKKFPRAWTVPPMVDPDDWSIWLDASYWKWCRVDKRRRRRS